LEIGKFKGKQFKFKDREFKEDSSSSGKLG